LPRRKNHEALSGGDAVTEIRDPLAQSVHAKLHNCAHQAKEDFNWVMSRYASERFLYRLSRSPYANRFVLKGASLFLVWMNRMHRPTHNIDLLGFGKIDAEELRTIFSACCRIDVVADGVIFDPDTITIEDIREAQVYMGLRVTVRGNLGSARLYVQVDIGTGDSVFPAPQTTDYPVLLDFPSPRLRVYPKESVIAEKIDAMIERGLRNSRMKDYYDIWLLSTAFDFDGRTLVAAIRETLTRRERKCETFPIGLTLEFSESPDKQKQWTAFVNKQRGSPSNTLADVVKTLQAFLTGPIEAVISNSDFDAVWIKNKKWQSTTRS
jgi:predicted nucleotidyltransferase component of viral defense system